VIPCQVQRKLLSTVVLEAAPSHGLGQAAEADRDDPFQVPRRLQLAK
jgi:hypothetical protein